MAPKNKLARYYITFIQTRRVFWTSLWSRINFLKFFKKNPNIPKHVLIDSFEKLLYFDIDVLLNLHIVLQFICNVKWEIGTVVKKHITSKSRIAPIKVISIISNCECFFPFSQLFERIRLFFLDEYLKIQL